MCKLNYNGDWNQLERLTTFVPLQTDPLSRNIY